MQSLLLITMLGLLASLPFPAHAAEVIAIPVALSLEERLQALEARQIELYHTLAEKKSAGLSEAISTHVTLSGLLEVEGSATRLRLGGGSNDSASDLTLATAQLGLDARVNEQVAANLTMLYEEGGEPDVDEAFVRLEQGHWQLRAGRVYLPFGAFHSHFISDPLTLALGETRQTAVELGYSQGMVQVNVFAFSGNEGRPGREDHINDGGLSLAVTPAEGLEFGVGVLSDLAESNAELLGGNGYIRRAAGWSAYAHVQQGRLRLEAEILAAAHAYDAGDLDADTDGHGDKPQAWNLEASWELTSELEVAARCAGSRGLVEAPRRQYGLDLSWSPWENVTTSLEYLRQRYAAALAPVSRTRAVEDSDQLTVQLALAF